jgi:hypothetical protein
MIKILGAANKSELIVAQQTALCASLKLLATWFNITQSNAVANRLQAAIGVLVDVFGYTPYTGPVYRQFVYTKEPMPKVGDVLKCTTGLRPVQSWTATKTAAVGFTGNNKTSVVGELLSKGLQLLNMPWLRQCVKQLLAVAKQQGLKKLAVACNELNATIRPAGHKDDEDEVIMLITGISTVRIHRVFPKYDG